MKRLLLFIFSILFVMFSFAQQRKTVGVVLSGGGAKGVAHVGALKVIEEAGIPIDIIVGTSMGSIVGGLYAIGYTPAQLDSMVRAQDWSFTLTDRTKRQKKTFMEKAEAEQYVISIPFKHKPIERNLDGFVRGVNLDDLFTDLTAGYHDSIDFEKLPIPFASVAVDLLEGKEVVFYQGRLTEAMRASMAIPAVFTPVRIGDMVLIDGGMLNNYPVDVARKMGAEIIIGIDVQSGPELKNKMNNLMDLMNKITDMTGKEKYVENVASTDLYIKVDVKGYTSASFESVALDTLMARGESAAMSVWDKLIELKKDINITNDYTPIRYGPYNILSDSNPIFVKNINFPGVNKKDAEKVMQKSNLKENSYVTMKMVKNAIDNLYALQAYTNVTYSFHEVDGGYNLDFTLIDRAPNYINLGVRFDSEEIAAVQVNGSYKFDTRIPTRMVVTGRLGKRASIKLNYLIQPSQLRYFNLSYMYAYNDINIYYKGNRELNTTYSFHQFDVGHTNILNRNMKYGFGLRYEYFDYTGFLFNKTENVSKVRPEGYFDYYALAQWETKDKKSFPNNGSSLRAEVNVYTDNFSTYDGHTPFGAASLWWEKAIPVTRRFTLLPAFYGRVIFGQDSPYPYMNMVGGEQPGRYVSHQLPFVGIGNVEVFENSTLIGRMEFRQRMGDRNYLSVITNYGLSDNHLYDIFKGKSLFGGSVGYGYDSFLGPIEAMFYFSNRTKELGFYVNIGFMF